MRYSDIGNRCLVLGALGRREPALVDAKEAVAIWRNLAAQRRDAFIGDLARSLAVLGDRFDDLNLAAEALTATSEAIAILLPYFVAQPGPLEERMTQLRRDYLRRSGAAG